MKTQFTHEFKYGCWWKNECLTMDHFVEFDKLGESDKDGIIYYALGKRGETHILKNQNNESI